MNQQARDQLAMVAAKHMNPERMMRVVANAIRTTPKLGQCEPMSLLGALMQCAALGIEPNTILGHAYLIPFDKKEKNTKTGKWEVVRTDVQLIVGYRGLIDLARRSGHITSIAANIHYSDDFLWEYEEGTEARLKHQPGPAEGKKLHAYAIAKFKDGGHAYVVLPWAHVMKIRDGSQGWQQAVRTGKTAESPWQKHEDEMAKKTAVRALAKYLPLSIEFVEAMQLDGSQADYRTFAMDPTQGVTIDGEVEESDADPQITEDAPAQIEQSTQQRSDFDERQRREPEPQSRQATQRTQQAKPAQRRDSGAYADGAKKLDAPQEQQKPAPDGQQVSMFQEDARQPAQDFASNAWGKTFLKDVADIGFDAAYDLHASEVGRVKDEAPELWAWLNEQAAEIEALAS
ncbi:UNVERIFIED_CONTAM: recT [Trichonephila clavipes]